MLGSKPVTVQCRHTFFGQDITECVSDLNCDVCKSFGHLIGKRTTRPKAFVIFLNDRLKAWSVQFFIYAEL